MVLSGGWLLSPALGIMVVYTSRWLVVITAGDCTLVVYAS